MASAAMLVPLVLALCTAAASAAVVEHTFKVGGTKINQLCMDSLIYTANQQLPGPTIEVIEGDTLVIHAVNDSPYPLSLHWHGVYQLRSGWNDGANKITQCPIQPSGNFTYRFNITGQEGTLWWHAHSSLLRATIYGALIIKPRNEPSGYLFPEPYEEIPILLGEWWNRNVDDVENDGYLTGLVPQISDALTINGMPGDQNPCKGSAMYEVEVEYGKTYLLRIINAALNVELFFKVAGHTFTVVAADASYTKPYATDVIVIAPGQTVDALMNTSASPGRYYMAAHVFDSKTLAVPFDRSTATGVVKYKGVPDYAPAAMPSLPPHEDVVTAGRFYWSLTGLARPSDPAVPTTVDHNMVVTFGLDQAPCALDQTKCSGFALVAVMNRNSFQFPEKVSLLEALQGRAGRVLRGVPGLPAAGAGVQEGDGGEEGEVQRRGGGGAAERGVQQRARHREPPDPPARIRLLPAGAGARAVQPGDEEQVQPRGPAGAQHRRRAGRRLGGDPVHGEQPRYVVHALSLGRAPAVGAGHGFRGAERTSPESAPSASR